MGYRIRNFFYVAFVSSMLAGLWTIGSCESPTSIPPMRGDASLVRSIPEMLESPDFADYSLQAMHFDLLADEAASS